MGHDISAYKDANRIAYLGIRATDYVRAGFLYKILNAEDFNNGVSGNGESKIYNYEEILKAKAALAYYSLEPFNDVRNIRNEQKAEFIVDLLFGPSAAKDDYSIQEILGVISAINEFLETILQASPFTKVEINFG